MRTYSATSLDSVNWYIPRCPFSKEHMRTRKACSFMYILYTCVCAYRVKTRVLPPRVSIEPNRTHQIKGSQQGSQHILEDKIHAIPGPSPATPHCRLWRKSPGHELAWNWAMAQVLQFDSCRSLERRENFRNLHSESLNLRKCYFSRKQHT